MIFLQDNFVFPPFIKIHFDGKIRKQFGQKSDFLALCVTGKGLEKEKVLGDIPIPTGSGHNRPVSKTNLMFVNIGIFKTGLEEVIWGGKCR